MGWNATQIETFSRQRFVFVSPADSQLCTVLLILNSSHTDDLFWRLRARHQAFHVTPRGRSSAYRGEGMDWLLEQTNRAFTQETWVHVSRETKTLFKVLSCIMLCVSREFLDTDIQPFKKQSHPSGVQTRSCLTVNSPIRHEKYKKRTHLSLTQINVNKEDKDQMYQMWFGLHWSTML